MKAGEHKSWVNLDTAPSQIMSMLPNMEKSASDSSVKASKEGHKIIVQTINRMSTFCSFSCSLYNRCNMKSCYQWRVIQSDGSNKKNVSKSRISWEVDLEEAVIKQDRLCLFRWEHQIRDKVVLISDCPLNTQLMGICILVYSGCLEKDQYWGLYLHRHLCEHLE